jgi:hypothetical protein
VSPVVRFRPCFVCYLTDAIISHKPHPLMRAPIREIPPHYRPPRTPFQTLLNQLHYLP